MVALNQKFCVEDGSISTESYHAKTFDEFEKMPVVAELPLVKEVKLNPEGIVILTSIIADVVFVFSTVKL